MTDISFIIPAKNTSEYVMEMIDSVKVFETFSWEIIIVDDHSEDDLFNIVEAVGKEDDRVKIFKNPGQGKVMALNHGFAQSYGKVIKCIDSDDTLTPEFKEFIPVIMDADATCHSYNIVDHELKHMADHTIKKSFISMDYRTVLTGLVSLPRAVWSFKREIADKVFPMPETLPYEDVWFSLVIKKHAKDIRYLDKPVYNYRQHEGQTYGGILNYDEKVTLFRANRLVRLIDAFEDTGDVLSPTVKDDLSYIKGYYRTLGTEKISISAILCSVLTGKDKLKIILIRKLRFIMKPVKLFQWKLDRLSASVKKAS